MTYRALVFLGAIAALPVIVSAAPGSPILRHLKRTLPVDAVAGRSAIDSCPAADLALPGSAAGSIARSDCALADLLARSWIPVAARQNTADVYRLEVRRSSVVRLEMTSAQFDARLYLVGAGSGTLIAQDDNSLGDRNAGLSVHLDAGSYLLIAASMSTPEGEYQVTTALENPRRCAQTTLTLDGQAEGSLGDPDCRFSTSGPGVPTARFSTFMFWRCRGAAL